MKSANCELGRINTGTPQCLCRRGCILRDQENVN